MIVSELGALDAVAMLNTPAGGYKYGPTLDGENTRDRPVVDVEPDTGSDTFSVTMTIKSYNPRMVNYWLIGWLIGDVPFS